MMHTAVVMDASVSASRLMPQDANHAPCRLWTNSYKAAGGLMVAPALLLIEVSAALTRQTGRPAIAKQAANHLSRIRQIRVVPLDSILVRQAVELAADLSLRAGDAVYVALANQMGIPLVSWDKQQLQRAGSLIVTYTPDNFPF